MMNMLTLLSGSLTKGQLCATASPILRIVGIVVLGIRIVVPLILIVMGMFDLAKAVTEKDEKEIKNAQNKLIKKAIAAGLVFLVTFLVDVVMIVVGNKDYKECMPCVSNPLGKTCNDLVNGQVDIYE